MVHFTKTFAYTYQFLIDCFQGRGCMHVPGIGFLL